MKLIRKILLPFFPENTWLRNHWWHRLSLTISYLWVGFWGVLGLIILYFFVTTTTSSYQHVQQNIHLRQEIQTLLNQQNRQWDYDSAYKNDGFSYEQVLQYLTTHNKQTDSDSNFQYDYWNKQQRDSRYYGQFIGDKNTDSGTQLRIDFTLFFVFILFIGIGVFTPNLIYRIILFITTNNSWRRN